MHDNLYHDIISDEGLVKWLRYGFTKLTGITEVSISAIIAYLRSVKKMSDDSIMRLAKQSYSIGYSFDS